MNLYQIHTTLINYGRRQKNCTMSALYFARLRNSRTIMSFDLVTQPFTSNNTCLEETESSTFSQNLKKVKVREDKTDLYLL